MRLLLLLITTILVNCATTARYNRTDSTGTKDIDQKFYTFPYHPSYVGVKDSKVKEKRKNSHLQKDKFREYYKVKKVVYQCEPVLPPRERRTKRELEERRRKIEELVRKMKALGN